MEQPKILQRMSVFSDSKFLARSILKNHEGYLCTEAAEHIEGLWAYCGELAAEIRRLHKSIKQQPINSEPLNQEQLETTKIHSVACTSEENRECIQGCLLPQSEQPIVESSLQKLALIQNYGSRQEQEREMCSLGCAACHNEKEELSHVCSAPKYEYLTLALPMKPNHSIQIYGHAKNTPTQFLPLAELFLTTLRDLAIRMVNDEPRAVRYQFDTFSRAASGLVSAMDSPLKEHHNKE